jgi:signal transduction histidine kinase
MTTPTPTLLASRLNRWMGTMALIAIVSGLSGIIGWLFGIRRLLSITEESPALMPIGAFALVFAGASLAAGPRRRTGRLLGVGVVALSLAAMAGYVTGANYGFGNLPGGITRGAGTVPGLPAPNSTVALGLLSVALLTIGVAPVVAQAAALLAGAIAYLAVLSELFGASTVQGLSAYTAMSPQTAVAICAIVIGIFCATPEAGVMPILTDSGVAGLAVRRFLPVAVFLPVLVGGLRVAGEDIGMFDTRFGTALMALASAAFAGILTVDIAVAIRRLDQQLDREHAARAVAQSESRIKDDVLSLLTQELRAPASVIHAQTHLLQAGVLTPERMQQVIDTLSRNAARLRQYVDDAIDVASLARGGVLLEFVEMDPREPIRRALDAWAPQTAAKRITVMAELPAVGFVHGDATRLQQIASNLLSNAVKFTPDGGEIRVETARDGDLVQLTIADNGVGIAPELLPHLFEPFRRSSTAEAPHAEGLGLGLAIVRHLAELHGGGVTAHSDGPGRGARFVVSLRTDRRSSSPLARA